METPVTEKAKEKAKTMSQELIPEAVASVSYNLKTRKGYPIIFTMRGADEDKLLDRMTAIELQFETLGMQADVRSSSYGGAKKVEEKTYVAGKSCPKCGGKLVQKTTKNGKVFNECENRRTKFNPATNKYEDVGTCSHMEWQEDATVGTEAPSPAQQKVLTAKGLWYEGITKAEANELIGGLR